MNKHKNLLTEISFNIFKKIIIKKDIIIKTVGVNKDNQYTSHKRLFKEIYGRS